MGERECQDLSTLVEMLGLEGAFLENILDELIVRFFQLVLELAIIRSYVQ
jgi:hypothetical protein